MAYSTMDVPYMEQPTDKDKQNQTLLIIIFATLLLTFVFSICAFVFSLQAAQKKVIDTSIPDKYLVPTEYILPPTNQMNIGSCWAWGTIYLLESQYRAQGIRQGYLKPEEYVTFSTQAYFTWLGKKCAEHPETKACKYGGISHGSSADGQGEQLYYYYKAFEDLKTSILPDAVCPYRPIPDECVDHPDDCPGWSFFWCPDMDKALEKNPIKFEIKNITSAWNLRDIKRLLLEKKRALSASVPLPNMQYWVPCNDPDISFQNSTACKEKLFPCPVTRRSTNPNANSNENSNADSNADETEYCVPIEVDSRIRDGNFVTADNTENVVEMGGHVMNLVGYNDDWVWRNRLMHEDTESPMRGALILHNSWRAEGHSVEYLMGERSEEDENVLCPNHMVPTNWIPASYNCTVANVSTDFGSCMNGLVTPIRGAGRGTQPDILRCNDGKKCDKNRFYVVERLGDGFKVIHQPGGLDEVHLISFAKNGEQYTDFKKETIRTLPFWALSAIFTPVEKVENDPQQCGYWVLSYKAMENMKRINYDLMDNFRITDIEIEFDKRSYAKSSSSGSYDTSYLLNSTHVFNKTTFDGPLPFDLVY